MATNAQLTQENESLKKELELLQNEMKRNLEEKSQLQYDKESLESQLERQVGLNEYLENRLNNTTDGIVESIDNMLKTKPLQNQESILFNLNARFKERVVDLRQKIEKDFNYVSKVEENSKQSFSELYRDPNHFPYSKNL